MKKIGVLALQGSFAEHIFSLNKLKGVDAVEVKSIHDLNTVSGLILPGGESTTMGKFLNDFGLKEPLKQRIKSGMPVWGTCAGMILMAEKIVDQNYTHLGVMNIEVRRNAYGSQLDSFITDIDIAEVSSKKIPAVFIRAPWVEAHDEKVKVLASIRDKVIAVRQNNMLATSFHPELTSDLSFHSYFTNMINE